MKVLFIYPNMFMMNMLPPAIAIFSALLKTEGHEVALFDTTYHSIDEAFNSDKKKEENLQVRPFNLEERGIRPKTTNLLDDLAHLVESFKPDLIAVSVVEDTWELGLKLIKHIEGKNILTIVGGVFATFAPEIVIREKGIDIVCIGEGEGPLVDLCRKLSNGEDYSTIPNLWIKKHDEIVKNPIREGVSMDTLPIMDMTIFEENRLYRPMAGKVYRMVPIETHRGCPYLCRFCNSPAQRTLYKEDGNSIFFRKKNIKKVHEEIKYFIDNWRIEYCYFTADTFLAWSEREFDEFIEAYSDFKLPFWMQTRPETITDVKMRKLKDVGLHRMSIGVEHGNEEFRREIIGRNVSNAAIIAAFKHPEKYGIPVSVNNIVGFPTETREIAQDTLELNRLIKTDTTNCYFFAPFHGTLLRDLSIEKGYIQEDTFTGCLTGEPVLDMPQFPKEQIKGFVRAFPLYAKFPKERWPQIRKTEEFTEEGNRIFEELRKEYTETFFV